MLLVVGVFIVFHGVGLPWFKASWRDNEIVFRCRPIMSASAGGSAYVILQGSLGRFCQPVWAASELTFIKFLWLTFQNSRARHFSVSTARLKASCLLFSFRVYFLFENIIIKVAHALALALVLRGGKLLHYICCLHSPNFRAIICLVACQRADKEAWPACACAGLMRLPLPNILP